MSDATTDTAKGRNNDPEVRLINDVAHALWLAASGGNLPKEAEARKTAWKDAKKSQMQLARGLMKRLSKKGVTLVRSDVSDPEAAAEADEADA
jgi:hypothetical protein